MIIYELLNCQNLDINTVEKYSHKPETWIFFCFYPMDYKSIGDDQGLQMQATISQLMRQLMHWIHTSCSLKFWERIQSSNIMSKGYIVEIKIFYHPLKRIFTSYTKYWTSNKILNHNLVAIDQKKKVRSKKTDKKSVWCWPKA